MNTVEPDVLIVGAGPAGLAAAVELRRLGAGKVLVVDRERQAGGIPRHCIHVGFGIRDLRRFMTGPAYAGRYVRLAEQRGVDIETETSVTGWRDHMHLAATSPRGLMEVKAKAVLLATGCRERPRAARLIPGSRPAGVFTSGMVQNLVYLHHQRVGRRAVVVGAEHVSFSAVLILKDAGAAVVAIVTDLPVDQSFFQYKLISAYRYRVPIYTNLRVTRILGRRRVEAVEVTSELDGSVRQIECDTVVFTGDWIPDNELAFHGGLEIDPGTRGPRVNLRLQTSVKGVFAAGNLIHAAETADVAALSGRYAARYVGDYLLNGDWPGTTAVPIECREPIEWVSPNMIAPGQHGAPHGHFILRVSKVLARPTITVWQASRRLWAQRFRRLAPNLPVYLSDRWLKEIDVSAGPLRLLVE